MAASLISKGKVRLNDREIKPAKEVRPGDIITITRENARFTYEIIEIPVNRVGPKLVSDFLSDMTPDEEKLKHAEFIRNQRSYRVFGTGRPSKKQRRDRDGFIKKWEDL